MISPRLLSAGAGALAVAALTASAAAAAVVPSEGFVFQRAAGQFDDDFPAEQSLDDIWTGTPRTLTSTVRAEAFGGPDKAHTAVIQSTITAAWASTNHAGTVDITDRGWTVAGGADLGSQGVAVELNTGRSDSADWSYAFTAGSDGRFELTGQFIAGGTDVSGLGAWSIGFTDGDSPLQMITLHDPFLSTTAIDTGQVGLNLVAGHDYRVALFSNSRRELASAVPFTGSETDHFQWSITETALAAPEPASWALMIVGFGGVGAMLRRRPRTPLNWMLAEPKWSPR